MPRIVTRNVLETHPEVDLISRMVLDRVPSHIIVAKLSLTVSPRTVDRFRQTVIKRALNSPLKTMKAMVVNPVNPSIPLTPEVVGNVLSDQIRTGGERGGLLERVNNLVDKRLARRGRWMADAEASQSVNPVTGEVHHDMNHGALARHDANERGDIELLSRLGGLLNDRQGDTTVNLVLCLPPPPDKG